MISQLLSPEVIGGIKCLNAVISAEMTKKVISNAIKMALHTNVPGNPEIYAANADYTKQAECAVLTLMFVAIKHGWDVQHLRGVLLVELGVSEVASEEILRSFDEHRTDLSVQNLTTGHSLPYLTNVEWKLTCDIKSSQSDATAGELNFTVSLGRFREVSGELETIAEFQCNVEELQALVAKLKEIERHCEKLAAIAK